MSGLRRRVAVVAAVGLGMGALPGSGAIAQNGERPDALGLTGTVRLVSGAESDPAANRVVRQALHRSGVREVVSGADPDSDQVTVWLGDGDRALEQLGVDDAEGMPAEGYVLATGLDQEGNGHIVLDGVDADGTFYAAHHLQDLLADGRVERTSAREAPAMRYRGLIEGFYGSPWSHDERLDLLDYLGAHRMNTYEYAPKDDPYHREKWRDPYPADRLAELGELSQRARANHVDFTFALSPGLSICYSSDADFRALTAKFDALYDLGVRAFTIPLDDIDYNTWHCEADRRKYGSGGGGAGRAQADLLNRVQREWVEQKEDVARLQMVPTEYYNVSASPYKKALREQLDQDVVVHWTGMGVIPTTITREQAARARAVFGHDILVWDNYPVNDYIPGRIPLAPYTGRENGLGDELVGIISNPMNQPALSKIALYSFGEFGWDDRSYDAQESWQDALAERAGGDRETVEALRLFADLSWFDGRLHDGRAPRLAAHLEEFWTAWDEGDTIAAAKKLRATLRSYAKAPKHIRKGVVDPEFAVQAKAWLDASERWIGAMQAALDALVALEEGDHGRAWERRQEAVDLVTAATQIRDVRKPHSGTSPHIGDGVVDGFVDEVRSRLDDAIGLGDEPTASTSLDTYAGHVPSRMLDGDPSTYFYSNSAPAAGDHVTVDLGRKREIGKVAVLMGKRNRPNDFLTSGVLEYSADGSTWTEVARGSTAEVRATAPDGTSARYVRYRALEDNSPYWLVVREFSVQLLDGTTLTASGTPEPAEGSRLGAAVDGDLDTAYTAARAPQNGEALTVRLSKPRTLEQLYLLQREGAAGVGTLEIRTPAGPWQRVGIARSTYTEIDVPDTEVEAVRMRWQPGGTTRPQVAELVPRFGE